MKKFIFFSAIALLALVTLGCEKEKKEEKNWTSLPPETQEGKNTIGCLIDGELWATNYWGLVNIMHANMYADFSIQNMGDGKDVLGKKLKGELSFQLKNLQFFISKEPYIYLTKFDTTNKIISGRFYCKAIHEYNKNDTIKVTEGRFDMKLNIKEHQYKN